MPTIISSRGSLCDSWRFLLPTPMVVTRRRVSAEFVCASVCLSVFPQCLKKCCSQNNQIWHRNVPLWVLKPIYFGIKRSRWLGTKNFAGVVFALLWVLAFCYCCILTGLVMNCCYRLHPACTCCMKSGHMMVHGQYCQLLPGRPVWLNGRAFARNPKGHRFESRPVCFQVTALGKLLTRMCLCHQAV